MRAAAIGWPLGRFMFSSFLSFTHIFFFCNSCAGVLVTVIAALVDVGGGGDVVESLRCMHGV